MAPKKQPVRAPFTAEEYAKHQKSQAEERRRRGLPTFTRQIMREEYGGSTAGEGRLNKAHRRDQLDRSQG